METTDRKSRITDEQKARVIKRYLGNGFKPSDLSEEQQALVVEHYLGIHPKYMLVERGKVKINYGKLKNEVDRYGDFGWKNLKRMLL